LTVVLKKNSPYRFASDSIRPIFPGFQWFDAMIALPGGSDNGKARGLPEAFAAAVTERPIWVGEPTLSVG
jgi:hypothetical protein